MQSKYENKSILGQIWKLRPQKQGLDLFQNIMNNRGIETKDQIDGYLFPSIKKGFHNPFLMKDMDRAVERIKKAVQTQERVIIFGDYDVDGISGTAILYNTLKIYGVNLSYRLPHRLNDGYGLNEKFIDEFKEKQVKLLITVDCGISCASQISKAREFGIDVIVTDHHTIPDKLPTDSYAILHPKQNGCTYPFKGLTGAGVAYKLASALITDKYSGKERDKMLFALLDLASLGTVADIGPLLGENRIIVKYGLEAMRNSNWPGLKLLMESAGIDKERKIEVRDIGFRIGPRINAAGRIDHPYHALQMLLHNGDLQEGKNKATHLERLNYERREMVQKALEEVKSKLTDTEISNKKIFIAWSKEWHVGILGLICSKIVEKYGLPAIAMQEFDEHFVASFRSNEKLNAFDALNNVKDLLEHYGGHAQAAGFSIKRENIPAFIEKISKYTEDLLEHHIFEQELLIDSVLNAEDINDNFVKMLKRMEPFGAGNEKPIFMLSNVHHENLKAVGHENQHLYFKSNTGAGKFSSIAFNFGKFLPNIKNLSIFDMAFHIEKNMWNGHETVQFQALDFKKKED